MNHRVFVALLVAATLGITAPAVSASAMASGTSVDPSPAFPPIGGWLPVFDDEFDGTFNGSNIVDTKNINGVATTDGLDDRAWVDLYGRSNADAVSVTAQAPGGDPGPFQDHLCCDRMEQMGQMGLVGRTRQLPAGVDLQLSGFGAVTDS